MRPLTKRMITKLQECHEMNVSKTNKLCPPEHFNSSLSGLYKRGLISFKKYNLNGKELMGVYLTYTAMKLLSDLKEIDDWKRLL